MRVVKAFAQEDREFARLMDRSHELYQSRMRTARFNARYSSTLQLLPMLGQLGVLAIGGWLALDGHITLGVFLAFASYLVQIITPVRLLSSMLATTQQARAGAERVFELLDMQPRVTDAPDARPVVNPEGAIELDDVTLRVHRRAARAQRHLAQHPHRASASASSALRVRARPRLPSSSPASTTPRAAPCASTASTCASSR